MLARNEQPDLMQFYFTVILAGALLLVGCGGALEGEQGVALVEPEIYVHHSDSLTQQVIDLRDRLETTQLISLLENPNPTLRFLATSAFASIDDQAAVPHLIPRLRDTKIRTQQAAAYALGQIGDARAVRPLIEAFQYQDSVGANNPVSASLLEAVGKCGNATALDQLATVSTYLPTDRHLIDGQVKAIYRFMQRNITTDLGTQRMLEILKDERYASTAKIYAANYLARTASDLKGFASEIISAYRSHNQPSIQMFLALALGKTEDRQAMNLLTEQLKANSDYRVKCNILRALGQHFYDPARKSIHSSIRNSNAQIAETAIQMMVEHGNSRYWREYQNLSLGEYAWPVKIGLLQATNRHMPAGNQMFRNINEDLLRQRYRTRNVHEKAAALRALADNPARADLVINSLKSSGDNYILKSAATQALVDLTLSSKFAGMSASNQKAVLNAISQEMLTGDIGVASIGAEIFSSDKIDFARHGVDAINILNTTLQKLQLPRDIEAQKALIKALKKQTGEEGTEVAFRHTHPIVWTDLDGVSDSTLVEVQTNRGNFRMYLIPSLAPGTVANFVDLIQLNFYEGKTFHRVVPNFVIQTGCERGDSYGSRDYTIRSELGQRYYDEEGYVGMASAGRHTESAQWFVTHCPTPHLDGNYTIFAKVISGMDVVHMTRRGDTIESIKLIN